MAANRREDARVVDNYELGVTLGMGMSGKVKLGRDISSGARVALKFIDLETMTQRKCQQLNVEISAMKSLSHENILELKHVNMDARYPLLTGGSAAAALLVLELAGGGELFDFMMYTGSFSEEVARTYFRQMVSALHLCHESGVCHRDIKPENLLMSDAFQLKLADFGLSAINEEAGARLNTECGTRAYMAPEVMAGQSYLGGPADIWSAGVVLFIMLCGNPPFQKADSTDWWFRKVSQSRYSAFWRAHERSPTVRFSDDAKAFLETIFMSDADQRATIQELMDHPWYCGPVVDEMTLEAHMKERKLRVDNRRSSASQHAAQAAAANAAVDPFAVGTMRSASTLRVPPLPAEGLGASGMNFYSTFSTIETASTVMGRLDLALEALGAAKIDARALAAGLGDVEEGDEPYTATYRFTNVPTLTRLPQMEAALPTDDAEFGDDPPPAAAPSVLGEAKEDVVLEVRLYKSQEDASYVGVVRRLSGELFCFQEVYKGVLHKIDDIVVKASDDAPGAEPELDDDMGLM